MELIYSRVGDYYLLNLKLSDPPNAPPIGKYGRMRKAYLKKHRKIEFNRLLLTEQLYQHLRLVDSTTNARIEMLMCELIDRDSPPDKETEGLAWVAYMNSLRHSAEEYIHELIYS
jgi:hypothetical protein